MPYFPFRLPGGESCEMVASSTRVLLLYNAFQCLSRCTIFFWAGVAFFLGGLVDEEVVAVELVDFMLKSLNC